MPNSTTTASAPPSGDLSFDTLLTNGVEGMATHTVAMLGLMALLGTTGFLTFVLPSIRKLVSDSDWQRMRRRSRVFAWIGALWALASSWLGLTVTAVRLLGPRRIVDNTVLLLQASHAGHVLGLLTVSVVLCLLTLRRLPSAVAFSFAAFAMTLCVPDLPGHVWPGSAASYGLHLTTAALWLGGILPMRMALRSVSEQTGQVLRRTFRVYGIGNALVLAASGLIMWKTAAFPTMELTHDIYVSLAFLKIAVSVLAMFLVCRKPIGAPISEQGSQHPPNSKMEYGIQAVLGIFVVVISCLLRDLLL